MISVVIPVYRDANNAMALADELARQQRPPGCQIEIILVDDGSQDGTTDVLAQHANDTLRTVTLPRNRGRAIARNEGANKARGEYIVFIDCDCRPVNGNFLEAHLRILQGKSVASCGQVTGDGHGFWSRYQDEASRRRERQHVSGITYSGSTQNLAVRKHAFLQVGGFDTRYREYGFEDRDLLVRLSSVGGTGWCADATVRHLDALSLPLVLAKMRKAGNESATLFAREHPDAYRALGYAAIDVRQHGWLRPIGWASRPLVRCAGKLERILDSRWLPYPLARGTVKVLGALAFMQGSMTKATD